MSLHDQQIEEMLKGETDPERQKLILEMQSCLDAGQTILGDTNGGDEALAADADFEMTKQLYFSLLDAMIPKGNLEDTDVEQMLQSAVRQASNPVDEYNNWRASYQPLFELCTHIASGAGRCPTGGAFGAYVWYVAVREWQTDRGHDRSTAEFAACTLLNMLHASNMQDPQKQLEAALQKLKNMGVQEGIFKEGDDTPQILH